MPWTKKDLPDAMKNLEEEVKCKALEIANSLVEDGYEDRRAISIAISQAREWYEKRGGKVSPDTTHRLVPGDKKWVLKSVDGNENFSFDTKEDAMKKVEDISKKSQPKS